MNKARIKIQTVETHDVPLNHESSHTLGGVVDSIVEDNLAYGRYPNRVTIDIDPPEENPARC